MSTAEAIATAKSMVQKVHGLRDNQTVCVICDAVEFITLLALPIAIPFIIIHLSKLSAGPFG